MSGCSVSFPADASGNPIACRERELPSSRRSADGTLVGGATSLQQASGNPNNPSVKFPMRGIAPRQGIVDVSDKSGEPGGVSPRTIAIAAKNPGADATRLT